MSIARDYARHITGMTRDIMTEEVTGWTLYGLLDYVAVTLAGCNEPGVGIATRVLAPGSRGPSLVFGKTDRMAPADAALINGTAAHALDFDDLNNPTGGHPSVVILPALFALAEETGAVGLDLLHAYAVGFETIARTGRGVHMHHYEKGWHPTATLGTFGATAACCTLLGLDTERTAHAMAIATSMAAGIKSNFGTPVKPLHAGLACRNGVLAARLAEEGFTGAPDAFEHSQGFFEVYNGAGTYDIARIFDGWGTAQLEIVHPGIGIKQYPCCGSTHPVADAAIALRAREALTPDRIRSIHVGIHPRRLKHTDRPDPQTELEAKFSVQYVAARSLIEGRIVLQHFENRAFDDPDVRDLMSRVTAAPHPDMDPASLDQYGAEVRVETADGRTVSERVKAARGRTADDPIPADGMKTKYDSCALRALSPDRAEAVYTAIRAFADCTDIRRFTALLEPGTGAAKSAAE